MPKLRVADVMVVYRDADVPDKCPHCGASLMEADSLRMIQYDASAYNGRLYRGEQDPESDREGFVYLHTMEAVADELVDGIDYWCSNCDTSILSGDRFETELEIARHEKPAAYAIGEVAGKRGWSEQKVLRTLYDWFDEKGLTPYLLAHLKDGDES